MMKWRAAAAALAVSLLLFLGCDNSMSPNNTLLPIEGKVDFKVQEFYPDYNAVSPPSIALFMQTQQIFGCGGYSINADMRQEGNEILVKMRGILPPQGPCPAVLLPAFARFPLRLSPGLYALHLNYRLTTDNYILEVTDSAIRVRPQSTHFTHVLTTLFWRFPPRTFAYYYRTADSLAALSQRFLELLQKQVALEEFQFPDSGAIAYSTFPHGGTPDPQVGTRFFRYQTELDFDRAGAILKSFAQANTGSGIWMVNWQNKRYLSWVLEQSQ